MDCIAEELRVPRKYLKSTNYNDRVEGVVHKSWLRSLLKYGQLTSFVEREQFEEWPQTDQDLEPSWLRIYITVFKKNEDKVIPLPRVRLLFNKNYSDLSFVQLLHYIMQSNHKNLWKEAFKKFSSNNPDKVSESHITLTEYNAVLREIIIRIYGCKIINIVDPNLSSAYSKYFEPHRNILPALCAIETQFCIFLIHIPFISHTLQDCVMFSPAILDNSYTKPLFIVYQLLQALLTLHDRNLTIGDITLNDIFMTDNMWIQIIPKLASNLHVQGSLEAEHKRNVQSTLQCKITGHLNDHSQRCVHCGEKSFDKVVLSNNETLEKLCELWVAGQISNFTYITMLNNASGRKYGEPNYHPVFPWVTDFSSRCGNNWRDLTKSKYRLNKGDCQLDLTYENSHYAHHVSDVLSSITYYVYMARRTPKSVLCKHVRNIWVPAEYPSSIQRLQEWTPDECIPEFFSDPNVFKSIHEDLNDLEVPPWSSSPEDFIEKHREALESSYVSERLHHWIDLTFGYKLSGLAAVKSKNVCLQLVDGHKNLTNYGIVQLFNHPHPPREFTLAFHGKTPPKIHTLRQKRKEHTNSSLTSEVQRQSEDEDISSGLEDDGTSSNLSGRSPLVLTRLLPRSKTSSNNDEAKSAETSSSQKSSKSTQKVNPGLGPKYPTFTSHIQKLSPSNSGSSTQSNVNVITVQKSNNQSGVIYLPKEYNPIASLTAVESFHGFLTKSFHYDNKSQGSIDKTTNLTKSEKYLKDSEYMQSFNESCSIQDDVFEDNENSFTNRYFTEDFEAKLKKFTGHGEIKTKGHIGVKQTTKSKHAGLKTACNYKQIVASCRLRELQILGCLIIEIFLSKYLRPQNISQLDFNERLSLNLNVLKYHGDALPCCVKYAVHLLLQVNSIEQNFRYPTVTDLGLPPPSAHQLLQPLLGCIFPFPKKFSKIYKFLSTLQEYTNISNELDILYHFDCNGEMCSKYENMERTKILFAQNIGECKVKYCAKELKNIFDVHLDSMEIVNILLPYVKELVESSSTSVLAAWYLIDPISRVLGPKLTVQCLLQSLLRLYESEQSYHNLYFNSKIAKLYHHSFLLRLIVRLGLKTFIDNFIQPLVEAVGGYKDIERSDIILHNHTQKLNKKTSNLKSIDDSSDLDNLSPFDEESSGDSDKNMLSPNESTNEPEVFEFETEDKLEEIPEYNIETLEYNTANVELMFSHSTAEEAIELNIECDMETSAPNQEENVSECLKSPTIPIPSTSYHSELITIGCDVGSKNIDQDYFVEPSTSRKSTEYFENNKSDGDNLISNQGRKQKRNNKISDMSADSLVWLSHRLGPVLTARHLSRNLLKMLTLCYVGKDNLELQLRTPSSSIDGVDSISIGNWEVTGDKNASKVLHCLVSIAALYGEQLILLQYFPHISELIALCKRKLTANLEGGLISCFALLKHIIPYLVDATLMDQLQDVILRNIFHPTARLLSSTKYLFPNGSVARNVLARKYLDALYVLALRIGADLTRAHLAVPALQRFFFAFNKVHGDPEVWGYKTSSLNDSISKLSGEHHVEVKRDGTVTEWAVRGSQVSQLKTKDSDSADSFSPPPSLQNVPIDSVSYKAMEELKQVFTSELAHTAFIPFLHYIGDACMELSLKNYSLIRDLCYEHRQEINDTNRDLLETQMPSGSAPDVCVGSTGSFGSKVALIGNRIDVHIENSETKQSHLLNLVSNRMENTNRHLRGNWLAYWEHEIGRADKDTSFNFKQIKLQSFNGHTNSIKAIQVLDNENSFMTGSKDKTVKLWSLRSQGDGSAVSQCQSTYTGHKKSVLSVTFLESLRHTASCDSVVHIWDPFMGSVISQLDGPRVVPVSILRTMPAPSAVLLAATDTTIKLIDTKLSSYIHEFKIAMNPVGLIRCFSVSPSGNWVAVGQSSGNIVILDVRTGLVLSSWKAHDGEILQLMPVNEQTLISSGLDQAISVWNVIDGKLKFNMKGATEPVHCLNMYKRELISGTTANRIGVHTSIDMDASFSSTRLRSDTFKGVLTSMAILPLNRLLLLGADSGNISLLC